MGEGEDAGREGGPGVHGEKSNSLCVCGSILLLFFQKAASPERFTLSTPFTASLEFETCWRYFQDGNTAVVTVVDPGLTPSQLYKHEPEYYKEDTCCIIWLLAFSFCSQWLQYSNTPTPAGFLSNAIFKCPICTWLMSPKLLRECWDTKWSFIWDDKLLFDYIVL